MILSKTATLRDASLFRDDLIAKDARIKHAVRGARILAVGAAGSIGSNTIHTLASYEPAALHIVDQNENALAELVRQFRSGPKPMKVEDFQTLPLDYGSPAMRLLLEQKPYDRILNFAAIKHVRSEKDPYSILQMLDTNIVKQDRFRTWISKTSPNADYFSVSTDKAANPVSFMGATKRIMEHVMFDKAREIGLKGRVNTARFANVAYSNGSLLQSFQNRFARGEVLACPLGIDRYFVSLEEAGHICVLASIIADHGQIAIPRLDPKTHLIPLQRVAEAFIRFQGFEPKIYHDEMKARCAVETCREQGLWPLLMTLSNTAGEKPYEEFVGKNEHKSDIGLSMMEAVSYVKARKNADVADVVARLGRIIKGQDNDGLNKDAIKHIIGELEPEFLSDHIDSDLNLDQRT